NGLGVDVAHQLADVLSLAGDCGTTGDAAGLVDGVAQALRQIEGVELRLLQADQRLTKLLQSLSIALARAFARAFFDRFAFVIRRARHPVSPLILSRASRLLQFCLIHTNARFSCSRQSTQRGFPS